MSSITKNCTEGEGEALQVQNYSKRSIMFKRKNSLLSERGLRTLWDLKHGAQAAIPAVLLLHKPLVYHTTLQHSGKTKRNLFWMAWTPHVLMKERAFPSKLCPPIFGGQRTRERLWHLSQGLWGRKRQSSGEQQQARLAGWMGFNHIVPRSRISAAGHQISLRTRAGFHPSSAVEIRKPQAKPNCCLNCSEKQ